MRNCDHALVVFRRDVSETEFLGLCLGQRCDYEMLLPKVEYKATGSRYKKEPLYKRIHEEDK